MTAERFAFIDRMMAQIPLSFAVRWCEPGPMGCACVGCANGPEYGAGHLSGMGVSKEEWEEWRKLTLSHAFPPQHSSRQEQK